MNRRWDSDSGINQSRHSLRIVPITRSQIAFILGLFGAYFNTLSPRAWIGLIELVCEDAVAVVNQELVSIFVSDSLTQLLQRPGIARVSRDVAVDQTTAAVLDHDNTYSSRNVAATATKKSHAMIPWACKRRKVDQRNRANQRLQLRGESVVGRGGTSAARTTSIRLGASESTSRGEPPPKRLAN